jgi:hypothetical protein
VANSMAIIWPGHLHLRLQINHFDSKTLINSFSRLP